MRSHQPEIEQEKSHGRDYTSAVCADSAGWRGPGEERDSGPRSGSCGPTACVAPDQAGPVSGLVRAAARRLPGGDGGVLGRPPLGSPAVRDGAGCAADRGQLRQPVPHGGQERQERHDRRGGDLRGRVASDDALRADQDLRAAGGDEPAPRARGFEGRTYCLHQPHPRRAGRARPGERPRARRCCVRCWPT